MEDIVKEAREAIELSYDFDRDNRKEAIDDLRFVAGFQWSDEALAERKGRPTIRINRSAQFMRQVANPIRQNMPTIKVEPDSDSDLNMAEIANGMFRRIQYNSSASHIYATAVEHMVACGIGWFRVATDYLDKESFDQEILIQGIFNPLSVYPDPSALKPDRSDMNWTIVSELMPKKAFENRWKGKKAESVATPTDGASSVPWGQGDSVRVAEFWKREETPITLLKLNDGSVVDLESFTQIGKSKLEELKFKGIITGERKSTKSKVTMTLVSGSDILEDAYECPCSWIPIIPVIGSEIPLENGTYRHGLIRFQREPQQLHNYFMSVAAESLGQQAKSPWTVTTDMIKRWKSVWDNANRQPTPYLPYDPDPKAPGAKPERIPPPALPTGFVQFGQMLADDMKATTGIYDAALGAKSNETSGIAIGQRVEQGNQATFHFSDNLEHGLEHLGRVMLDMIPKVYDTKRTLRLIGADDTETEVEVNVPTVQYAGMDGLPQQTMHNDLSQMKFKSVRVTMGPSYATQRAETANMLLQLVQALPIVQEVGADKIIKAQTFEGAEDLAERVKAVIYAKYPMIGQAENPEMMQPQGPDPMMEMQNQQMQEQMQGQSQAMQFELQGAEATAQQQQAKAAQEAAKIEGIKLDNALKVKKLREPTPQALRGPAGNQGRPQGRAF